MVNTKRTGTFTIKSPASMGKPPAALAELVLLTVTPRASTRAVSPTASFNKDASDVVTTVKWP
jgi:hypothetical protein